jgi:DNA invertase Pin-like site-specific DNA recombinase
MENGHAARSAKRPDKITQPKRNRLPGGPDALDRTYQRLATLPGGNPSLYAYIRVSTDKQDPAAQAGEIVAFCERNKAGLGRENVAVDYDVSAAIPCLERPALKALLPCLREGDVLFITEQSRISRDQLEIGRIMEYFLNAKILLFDIRMGRGLCGTYEDIMMTHNFAYVSRKERQYISERTRAALAGLKAEGQQLGPPRGPQRSRLDQHSDQIHIRRAAGESLRVIAEDLKCDHKTLHVWIQKREQQGLALLAKRWPDPVKTPLDAPAILDAALALGLPENVIVRALLASAPQGRDAAPALLEVVARRLGNDYAKRLRPGC